MKKENNYIYILLGLIIILLFAYRGILRLNAELKKEVELNDLAADEIYNNLQEFLTLKFEKEFDNKIKSQPKRKLS